MEETKQKQELNFDQILKQNININKREKKSEKDQQLKDKEKDENDEAEQVHKHIQNLYQLEMDLEQQKRDIESKGWDLKFQNYWGYIVSARDNFEQSIKMCEKLFKHVGQFRVHSEQHFKNIVDNMHKAHREPDSEIETLQEWDKLTKGLQPCPEELLTGDMLVLLDEIDQTLYKNAECQPQNPHSLQDANIYFHDNIIFKITHPAEHVGISESNQRYQSEYSDL